MGHVIFTCGTTLLAVPFDLMQARATGPAIPLIDDGRGGTAGQRRGRHYALSSNGTLAYVPAAEAYALVLVEPNGDERQIAEPHLLFENPRFSPATTAAVRG